MPDEWKGFPAYQLKPGTTLSLEVIRRGDPDPAPDQLHLDRSWWLDFNGAGFTVHDRISGTLSRTWQLSMGDPMQAGTGGRGRPRSVDHAAGGPVVTRRSTASWPAFHGGGQPPLVRTSSSLPAVGWDHDFQRVRGVLHLPPGWTLLSTAGVDVPPGAWVQRWTLLDFFLVLIIAISATKIRSRMTGLLVLLTLVLTFHEPGAPRHVWLHLLAVAALLKYIPGGWFKRLVTLWGGCGCDRIDRHLASFHGPAGPNGHLPAAGQGR